MACLVREKPYFAGRRIGHPFPIEREVAQMRNALKPCWLLVVDNA
ncbi:MAG: hypothetical protein WCE51_16610 [Chthoniobacterales bacterium]